MSKPDLNLTFVGYGSIAASHLRALRELGGVRLDAVVGRRPEATEAFARDWGFAHWTLSLEEALARPGVDAVIICSPSDQHAAQAEQALAAGKHVLVEIPLAMSLADSERVAALAERAGLRLMVAHTQRFFPALIELRRRIATGELRPHHLVCRWFFLRRSNTNWEGKQRSWTDNLLWHHSCHVVDAALWLLGEAEPGDFGFRISDFGSGGPDPTPRSSVPKSEIRNPKSEIRAFGHAGPPHAELGIPLDLDLLLRAGDVPVNVAMSYNSPWPMHDYLVIGEEATIRFDNGRLIGKDGALFTPDSAHPIREQDREFLAAIREDREATVNAPSVLPAMRALQDVQQILDAGTADGMKPPMNADERR